MSFATLLLRVLLCIGLLVNGSAQAIALTHAAAAVYAADGATSPCHESEDAATGASAHTQAHMSHSVASRIGRNAPSKKPDCCKADACDCAVACSHGVMAGLAPFGTEGRRVADPTLSGPMPARYASPALPRLIRPPIV